MKKTITTLLILLVGVLVACTAPVDDTTPQEPTPEPTTPLAQEVQEEPVVQEEEEPVLSMDSTTQELRAKGVEKNTYSFTFMRLPDGRAETQYYVRDGFVRVEPRMPSTRAVDSIDTVYLDLDEQLAVGYCERGGRNTCQNEDKIADVEFSDYYVELPHELIQRLDNGERLRSVTYRNHVADVVRAQLDGQQATLTIHQFQGLPLKVEFADGSGVEFREISFGAVPEERVTPPSGW